jgi:hypothetical protein
VCLDHSPIDTYVDRQQQKQHQDQLQRIQPVLADHEQDAERLATIAAKARADAAEAYPSEVTSSDPVSKLQKIIEKLEREQPILCPFVVV